MNCAIYAEKLVNKNKIQKVYCDKTTHMFLCYIPTSCITHTHTRSDWPRLDIKRLPGGPVFVGVAMAAAVAVVFKFRINCHILYTLVRKINMLSIFRIYNHRFDLKTHTYQ